MVFGYALALGSAVLYGAADFLGGLAARRASTIATVVLSQAAGALVLAVIVPVLPPTAPRSQDLFWGAAAGVAGGTGVAFLYRALAVGLMAVVAPTTAVCAVAIPVIAGVIAGERPGQPAVAGIGLALVAIILVSQSRNDDAPAGDNADAADIAVRSRRRRTMPAGLGLALLSGVAIGLFFLALARTGSNAGMWPLLAARLTSVTLFAVLAIIARRPLAMASPAAVLAIVGGIIDMGANALYLVATRYGLLTIVVTLASLYPASTVILARVVLRERFSGWQIAGIVCALAAVILIVGATG